jgi:hypothetical protein
MFELGFSSGRPQHLSRRSLPPRILAILIVAGSLAGITPAFADPNNPTTLEDCQTQTQQFESRISTLRTQLPLCSNRVESFVMVPQCNHPATRSCAPLYAQICELGDQKSAARESCAARVQLHRQREAEDRRRQADEQRAEQAREREAAELERAQGNPMAAAIDVQIGAVAGGLGAAAAGGIPVGLPIGALHLSNEFSAIGGAAANRIRMDSLNQLENALNAALGMSTGGAGPNASSPYERRPTQAQIAYELNAPLDQAERADTLQVHLPFGGESAVVGANAQYLTDLAYARASGTLTTPLAQTQVQSAIGSAGVTGGQGATLAIIEDDEPQRQPSEYEDGLLQQQRLASLGDIQGRLQREQLAEAERQRAMQEQWALQEQQRVVQEQQHSRETSTEEGFSKPDCVEVEHLHSVPGFSMIRNYCGYDILISMTNKQVMNYGSNYACDRNLNMRAYITSPWPSHDFNQVVWECVSSINRN